ncbi:MAG: cytidine deaminase [Acidimicrobiia bacterium]
MEDELLAEAAEVAEAAYAPYSNFRVGAVAVAADGQRFTGVNVENAAYGSTQCAESSAMANAVTAGHTDIKTIAVACIDAEGDCYPCGNCRQMMRELGVETIIVRTPDGKARQHTLAELLPHSFGSDSL